MRYAFPASDSGVFYVIYRVTGFDGEQCAGPYPKDDIEYQSNDIADYQGVSDVRIEATPLKKEKDSHDNKWWN